DGELVHLQREIDFEYAGGHPREVAVHHRVIGAKLEEFANRLDDGQKSQRHGTDRDGIHRRLRPVFSEQAVDGRAGQRQRENDPEMVEHRHQNLSKSTFSTFNERRLCAIVMTIARPTAASAAAMTITKNTNISPSSWLCARANATKARFTALSISSMDIKIVMILRLKTNATTPSPNKMALKTR